MNLMLVNECSRSLERMVKHIDDLCTVIQLLSSVDLLQRHETWSDSAEPSMLLDIFWELKLARWEAIVFFLGCLKWHVLIIIMSTTALIMRFVMHTMHFGSDHLLAFIL